MQCKIREKLTLYARFRYRRWVFKLKQKIIKITLQNTTIIPSWSQHINIQNHGAKYVEILSYEFLKLCYITRRIFSLIRMISVYTINLSEKFKLNMIRTKEEVMKICIGYNVENKPSHYQKIHHS